MAQMQRPTEGTTHDAADALIIPASTLHSAPRPQQGSGWRPQAYSASYTDSCAFLQEFKAYAEQEQVVMDAIAVAMQPSGDPSNNLPCPHGCGCLIPQGHYAKHQRFCSHRPMVHPFCGEIVKMSDFEEHSKFCKGHDAIPTHSQRDRVALVIGVNGYCGNPSAALKNCINDAKAIHSQLQQLGFDSCLLENPSVEMVQQAQQRMLLKIHQRTVVFFHFSGHGHSLVTGQPVAVLHNRLKVHNSNAEGGWLTARDIYDGFSCKSVTHCAPLFMVLSLDCCRSGSDAAIKPQDYPGCVMVLSCSPGQCALDGSGQGKLSPYSSLLVDYFAQAQKKDFRYLMLDLVKAFPKKLSKKQQPEVLCNVSTVSIMDQERDAKLQQAKPLGHATTFTVPQSKVCAVCFHKQTEYYAQVALSICVSVFAQS